MQKQPAIYIMANRRNGTLYTGVTSNLQKRDYQHKTKQRAASLQSTPVKS